MNNIDLDQFYNFDTLNIFTDASIIGKTNYTGCCSIVAVVKDEIIDKLVDELLEDDTKAEYKALIKLREDYGLTFNDDEISRQYDNAKNNWLYGKDN